MSSSNHREPGDPRIALVSPGWPPESCSSGIVTYTGHLHRQLIAMGIDSTVLVNGSLHEGNSEVGVMPMRLSNNSFVKSIETRHGFEWLRGIRVRRKVKPIIEAARRWSDPTRSEIIELEESFGWARDMRARLNASVAVHLHGPHFIVGRAAGLEGTSGYRSRCEAEREGILAAAAVRANSQATLDLTQEYLGTTLPLAEVIHLPIDVATTDDRWKLDRCDRKSILFVGRFDRLKGGDLAVDAFVQVFSKHPDAELVIAGCDRGYRDDHGKLWSVHEYADDRIPSLACRDRIRFVGQQSPAELAALRRRANVVVVASRFETFGYTAAEAMAMGCPLVVTRAGGLCEVVDDGLSGLVVDSDSVDALAEGLLRILEDDSLANRLGESAVADCAARFSPEVVAQKSMAFYRRVAGNSSTVDV